MSVVVNLNRFRKRKAKLAREKQAETNRRLHGRTNAERARDELQKRQLAAKLDGALLDKTSLDKTSLDEPDVPSE